MARSLKFRLWKVEGLYYLCSENKGADELRGYREADLRLCFRMFKKPVFFTTRLIYEYARCAKGCRDIWKRLTVNLGSFYRRRQTNLIDPILYRSRPVETATSLKGRRSNELGQLLNLTDILCYLSKRPYSPIFRIQCVSSHIKGYYRSSLRPVMSTLLNIQYTKCPLFKGFRPSICSLLYDWLLLTTCTVLYFIAYFHHTRCI